MIYVMWQKNTGEIWGMKGPKEPTLQLSEVNDFVIPSLIGWEGKGPA